MIPSLNNLKFHLTWRPYQAKVLKNFDKHIEDNHFHIIAPPGSGKTILGIELIRKIEKKTLILAPTLTVRNQWENRLQNFFTKNKSFKEFSFDLKKPAILTFSTYQSLHALYTSFEDKLSYFQFFKDHNIEVFLLDEAHHLKKEWWNCLYDLKEHTNNIVISLTATPPYDSANSEVKKYFQLCGEIDDEIVVPDLVKEKNLCPHQDLIYISEPLDYEINLITKYRFKIADFIDQLKLDQDFIRFLKSHRFFKNPEKHLEEIYKNPEYFSALLIFLNEVSEKINHQKLMILGFDKKEIVVFPKINHFWIETLLQYILVFDRTSFVAQEDFLLTLEKKLRKINIFSKNKVNLTGNDLLYKSLSTSPSKLKSISKIVNKEQQTLKDDLRCVILSDYIRKEFLTTADSDVDNINKLGILPIFHQLRIHTTQKHTIGVLTGSLVIIHVSIISKLEELVEGDHLQIKPFASDQEFVIVNSSKKNNLVNYITQLFEAGYIKTLIGTKSLLGEGWDAPSINSLILASVVGSFVTSNQMRGRAIRTDAKKPDKVGIIWHLACIDFSVENGGKDLEILSRRFRAFLGISNSGIITITNGIDRLQLPKNYTPETITKLNASNFKKSQQRETIKKNWEKAIQIGKGISHEIVFLNTETPIKKKQLFYRDLVKHVSVELIIGISLFIPEFLLRNLNILLQKGTLIFFYALTTGLALTFGFKIYKTIKLYLIYGYMYKKIRKIALAIIDTLYQLEIINTPREEIKISTQRLEKGNVVCTIEGANKFENTVFIKALEQLLQPVNNPKYLLIKTDWFLKNLNIQNFFSVPEVFESTKKKALLFKNNWDRYLGKSKLIYTRTSFGRKLLLKARLLNIHNADKKITKKNVVWK